jgi:hypothetical protein
LRNAQSSRRLTNDSDDSDDDDNDIEEEFTETNEFAEALCDFKATEPSDLSFKKGDFVVIREKNVLNGRWLVTHRLSGMIGRVDPAKFKVHGRRMVSDLETSENAIKRLSKSVTMTPKPASQRNSLMNKFENMFTTRKKEALTIDASASSFSKKEVDLTSPISFTSSKPHSPISARDISSDESLTSPNGLLLQSSFDSPQNIALRKPRIESTRSRGSAIISGRARDSLAKEIVNPNGPCFKCLNCTGFQSSGMASICLICSHHISSHKQ